MMTKKVFDLNSLIEDRASDACREIELLYTKAVERLADRFLELMRHYGGQMNGHSRNIDLTAEELDCLPYKWKLFEKRLDYSQAYFDHHAKQRMQVFNFFAAFAALTVNAWVILLGNDKLGTDNYALAGSVAIIAGMVSLMFRALDARNENLVHIAEANLAALEEDVLFGGYTRPVARFRRLKQDAQTADDKHIQLGIHIRETRPAINRHGFLIPMIQYLVAAVFFLAGVYSFVVWTGPNT